MKFPRHSEFYRWVRKDMIPPADRNTAIISVFSTSIEDAERTFKFNAASIGTDPEDYLFIGTTTVMDTYIEFERYA